MEVRWLPESEVPQAARLVSEAFLASPVFAGIDEERYSQERIAESMTRGRVVAAFRGTTIVAAATLFPRNPASDCDAFRTRPQLGLVGVDSAYEGRGIARQLVHEVERRCRDEGLAEVALSVTQRGAALVTMYERLGYRITGEFQWPGAVDPSFIMIKPLGEP